MVRVGNIGRGGVWLSFGHVLFRYSLEIRYRENSDVRRNPLCFDISCPIGRDCGRSSLIASVVQFASLYNILLLLFLSVVIPANLVDAQEPALPPEPNLDVSRPFPPPHERVLSPIPQQFDWIDREVRSNPLLETPLSLLDGPHRFTLLASLVEQYSDNFFQTESNAREEYRTSASLGTVYRWEGPQSFISLANTFNANYDAKSETNDIGFVNLVFSAGHELPKLSLALNESFVRDDDPIVASPSGIRRGRRTFIRNRVSPQMRYKFTRLTSLDFRYANTFVESEEGEPGDDSITHDVTTRVQHRFSRLWTGTLSYTFTYDKRDRAADTQAYNAFFDIGYMLDRRTHIALSAFGLVTDRIGAGQDSQTYGASVNLRRQLASLLAVFVSVGSTTFDRDGEDPDFYVNWQINVDGTLPFSRHTSLRLDSQQRVHDTTGDVDQVGMVLSTSVNLSLNHKASRFLLASLFASFNRTEFLEDSIGASEAEITEDRKDNLWRAGGRLSYALTRTISMALEYLYQERFSNAPDGDFEENRVYLMVSGNFSVL